MPREEKDLGVTASLEYLLAYDNVSHLPQWLSDAICRISTGAGYKYRKLYTNGELNVFDGCRPFVFNGIPQCVESNDLMNRCVMVERTMMTPEQRKDEKTLNAEYEVIAGKVLGGILDLLANGLGHLHTTNVTLPRMADSIRWITACLGNNSFIDAYATNEDRAVEYGLDTSPIARGIVKMLKGRGGKWKGNSTDLLKDLSEVLTSDERGNRLFPDSAKAMGHAIRRDEELLINLGIKISRGRSSGGERVIIFESEC